MNEKSKIHENVNTKNSRLAKRPERNKRRRVVPLLFLLCGCLIILSGGGILIWQWTSSTSITTVYNHSTSGSSNAGAKQPTGCTGAREPVDMIMQQAAQGLHLTVAQVQARVLAGKTVEQIATEQGLTAAQLHDVEIQAIREANNQWLHQGCSSQQDVQDNLQRDIGSPVYMDDEFTNWFKG